jgi:HSP20 family protein
MEDVYDRMSRLIQDFLGDSGPVTARVRLPEWTAPADIEESDNEHIVEIDLPGVSREDINLEQRDSELRMLRKAGGTRPRRIEVKGS